MKNHRHSTQQAQQRNSYATWRINRIKKNLTQLGSARVQRYECRDCAFGEVDPCVVPYHADDAFPDTCPCGNEQDCKWRLVASHEHFIERCKFCQSVINQCRCMGSKKVRWSVCSRCATARQDNADGENAHGGHPQKKYATALDVYEEYDQEMLKRSIGIEFETWLRERTKTNV